MLALLLIFVIVATITIYQVYTQGLFSAMIMAVLSIIAAMIAFNYFEALAAYLPRIGLANFCPQALSLMGLFIVSLLILRELTDRIIRANMKFPLLIDRAGASFFGLIAGLTIAGVAAVGFQLLPIPAAFLSFDRCPDLSKPDETRNLYADGFIVSLFGQASDYCFAGKNKFNQNHPDMLDELYFNRLALDPASRREAAPDALRVTNVWAVGDEAVKDLATDQTIIPGRNGALIAARLSIKPGTDDKKDRGARDVDGAIRFTLGNIRMVGFNEKDPHSDGTAVYPLGMLKPGARVIDRMSLNQGKFFKGRKAQIDLLFSWPGELEKITPLYIEFKRTSRAKLPSYKRIAAAEPPELSFDGYQTAQEATLKPTQADLPFICKKLTILPDPHNQPLKDIGMPPDQVIAQITDQTIEKKDDGYRRLHVVTPAKATTPRAEERKYTKLFVPAGFSFVLLEMEFNQTGSFVMPILIDTLGNKYRHSGFIIQGTVGEATRYEVGYSVYKQENQLIGPDDKDRTAFPKEFKLLKEGKIDKGRFIFLIGRSEKPVGLIGVRTRQTGREPTFWPLAGDLDALLIPTK